MATGRKPKPSQLHKLHGNPGKRKKNALEPEFEAAIPDAPDLLEGEALKEWHRVTHDLAAKQVITNVDMAILALYCQTFADWTYNRDAVKSEGFILTNSKGDTKANPRVRLVNTFAEQLAKYAAELGITPSSRSRVKMIGKPAKEPDKKQALAEKLFKAQVSKHGS